MPRAVVVALALLPAVAACRGDVGAPAAPAPLAVVEAPTPRLRVPGYDTSGSIPQVTAGRNLQRVNAALREAVLRDQRAHAPGARAYSRVARPACRGVYRVVVDRSLISASTGVVSALLPQTRLYPCVNTGKGWISITVRVPSGTRVTLAELFRDPEGEGLFRLGVGWFRAIARDWRLECVVRHLDDYEPTLRNYRFFALTPRGLALAFWQEPACNRIVGVVPYDSLRPYLSRLGQQLIAEVRRPR